MIVTSVARGISGHETPAWRELLACCDPGGVSGHPVAEWSHQSLLLKLPSDTALGDMPAPRSSLGKCGSWEQVQQRSWIMNSYIPSPGTPTSLCSCSTMQIQANDLTLEYQTSKSASSSKFHQFALLVALVSYSSNFHHWHLWR